MQHRARVLHLGFGPLGRRVVADLIESGVDELIGIVDSDPGVGSDAPVPVLRNLDAVRNWDEIDCCVVTTRSTLRDCEPTFRALLERGQSVVSTCEELAYPWLRQPELAEEFDALARKHGGRLLGTGVNPGFLMDAFPAFAATITRRVQCARVFRLQDASPRRLPFQHKIGAGMTRDEFARGMKAGTLGHVGLGESLHLLARLLDLPVERWEEEWSPIMQSEERLAGVRQVARGYGEGRLTVELVFEAALGLPDPHDRLVLEGEPSVDLVWKGGVHGDVATSAVVVRCIGRLLAAAPGLHTMGSLPTARRGGDRPLPREERG